MGKTSAECMKALRCRLRGTDPEFMKKESERISLLQKRQRASVNEEELTAAREYNWLKTKRCRERKNATETIKIAPVTKKGFPMPQAYGKAIKKLKRPLPISPSKRVEAVIGLVSEVGLKLKESDFNRSRRKCGGLSDEVKSQGADFYYQADVIYTAPGIKDEITVLTEKGKEDEKILSSNVFALGVCYFWICLPRQWNRFHNVH